MSRGRAAAYRQTHARILLLCDENQADGAMKDEEIARALKVGTATVERVRRRCVEEGLEAGQRGRRPHPAGMQDLPLALPLRVARQPAGPPAGQRDRTEPVPRSGSGVHRPPGGAGRGDQGAASADRRGNRRCRRVRHRLCQVQSPSQP